MKTKRSTNPRPRSTICRTSARVGRKSCCLASVPNPPNQSSLKLKRIVVPTDFSKPSLQAIKYAVHFAENSGATIYLVNVIERAVLTAGFDSFPLVLPEAELEKISKETLLSLAATEIEELIPVEVEVRVGKTFRQIVNFARETNADLIVIATHGRSGINHMLLGSTAELIVRHATCPVLVVREGQLNSFNSKG